LIALNIASSWFAWAHIRRSKWKISAMKANADKKNVEKWRPASLWLIVLALPFLLLLGTAVLIAWTFLSGNFWLD